MEATLRDGSRESAYISSRGSRFLARALVAPVITSVASGEPFRKGNAVRIAWTGMVVGVVGMLAPTLPHLAALGVMTSFDGLGDNPLAVVVTPSVVPVGIAALILIVAEAFRRGTQINDDVAGLV